MFFHYILTTSGRDSQRAIGRLLLRVLLGNFIDLLLAKYAVMVIKIPTDTTITSFTELILGYLYAHLSHTEKLYSHLFNNHFNFTAC